MKLSVSAITATFQGTAYEGTSSINWFGPTKTLRPQSSPVVVPT